MLLAAGERGVPFASRHAQQVKGAVCGNGRADKEQVQRMVQTLLARPTAAARPWADALAVAICHANRAPLQAALARLIALLAGDGRRPPRRPRVVVCGGVGYRAAPPRHCANMPRGRQSRRRSTPT